MRVAVIVALMLVVATPSQASRSCMSKTEARQHFGSVHIYWHGRDRCWDATPTLRHRQIQTRRKFQIREVQRSIDRPSWHDAMSEMLPGDEPMPTAPQTPWINRWVDIEPSTPSLNVRWVDIAQTPSTSVIERKPETLVSPHVVLLAFTSIAIGLTLAIIEFLFRRTVRP